jgi:hypothetical protein
MTKLTIIIGTRRGYRKVFLRGFSSNKVLQVNADDGRNIDRSSDIADEFRGNPVESNSNDPVYHPQDSSDVVGSGPNFNPGNGNGNGPGPGPGVFTTNQMLDELERTIRNARTKYMMAIGYILN